MPNIYVASSWRNTWQPAVVQTLRDAGHTVYDFREPAPDVSGFSWSSIDRAWERWNALEYLAALKNPIAEEGFRHDFEAMQRCDAMVLVLPAGRSAHLELGWACGAGKRTAVLLEGEAEDPTAELMVKMADFIALNTDLLLGWLSGVFINWKPQGATIKKGGGAVGGVVPALSSAVQWRPGPGGKLCNNGCGEYSYDPKCPVHGDGATLR